MRGLLLVSLACLCTATRQTRGGDQESTQASNDASSARVADTASPLSTQEDWTTAIKWTNGMTKALAATATALEISGVYAPVGAAMDLGVGVLELCTYAAQQHVQLSMREMQRNLLLAQDHSQAASLKAIKDAWHAADSKLDGLSEDVHAILQTTQNIWKSMHLQAEESFFDRTETLYRYFLTFLDGDDDTALNDFMRDAMPRFVEQSDTVFSPVTRRWQKHLDFFMQPDDVLERVTRIITVRMRSFQLISFYFTALHKQHSMALLQAEQYNNDLQWLRPKYREAALNLCTARFDYSIAPERASQDVVFKVDVSVNEPLVECIHGQLEASEKWDQNRVYQLSRETWTRKLAKQSDLFVVRVDELWNQEHREKPEPLPSRTGDYAQFRTHVDAKFRGLLEAWLEGLDMCRTEFGEGPFCTRAVRHCASSGTAFVSEEHYRRAMCEVKVLPDVMFPSVQ
eukprot:TRINITY_DN9286_c0_g1_i5.p1 TRINITY_DN9286_c0_g1~~TRINITY_DN9286_c0_g1_i5.p1  ORF type:complete len:457 (+),score=73.72 TRINITY_DN9286_c0_g1_i5:81-1451(+)